MKNKSWIKHQFVGSVLVSAVAVLTAVAGQAGSTAAPRVTAASVSPPTEAPKEVVNYIVRVQWKEANGTTNVLQVLTAPGDFKLNTAQPAAVKINESEVPITVTLQGVLTVQNPEKGRLKLYLGRTLPFVTSTAVGPSGTRSSSYQQVQVGLDSSFAVTFGKPVVIQADEKGEVSVLVKREEG